MSDKYRKIAVWSGLLVGSLIALVGVAHTPLGRPLLGLLGVLPGCPVSLDTADPAKAEAFRLENMRAHAGVTQALGLPASSFELGSSRPEVEAWLLARGAKCEARRSGSVLACARLEKASATRISELDLQFDARDRLVAVDLFREPSCSNEALQYLKAVEKRLVQEVGPVTMRHGKAQQAFLESGRFHRFSTEFRYSNYRAELSVMGDGAGGMRVRETYQWLPDQPS